MLLPKMLLPMCLNKQKYSSVNQNQTEFRQVSELDVMWKKQKKKKNTKNTNN